MNTNRYLIQRTKSDSSFDECYDHFPTLIQTRKWLARYKKQYPEDKWTFADTLSIAKHGLLQRPDITEAQ